VYSTFAEICLEGENGQNIGEVTKAHLVRSEQGGREEAPTPCDKASRRPNVMSKMTVVCSQREKGLPDSVAEKSQEGDALCRTIREVRVLYSEGDKGKGLKNRRSIREADERRKKLGCKTAKIAI